MIFVEIEVAAKSIQYRNVNILEIWLVYELVRHGDSICSNNPIKSVHKIVNNSENSGNEF